MSYEKEIVAYLHSFVNFERLKDIKFHFRLKPFKKFLKKANSPHKALKKIITVAGTKGKGSTVHFINSILTSSGLKTGMYISPHLISVRERIRINNTLITWEELLDLIEGEKPLLESSRGEITYFELLTYIALKYFVKKNIDVAILEVGLGGKYDATNACDADIPVLTKIGLDHTKILGKDIESIIREKAGIIRKDRKVYIGYQNKGVLEKILKEIKSYNVRPIIPEKDYEAHIIKYEKNSTHFLYKSNQTMNVEIRMRGEHQVYNAALALKVCEDYLKKLPLAAIKQGIKNTYIPGRLEVLSERPYILVDVAHNIDSVYALKKYIKRFAPLPLTLIFGCNRGKDYKKMLELLKNEVHRIILTKSQFPRALEPEEIKENTQLTSAEITHSIKEAIEKLKINHSSHILVTGSFYIVSDFIKNISF